MKTRPGALPLFQLLTSVPTAPFREAGVAERALLWIREQLGARVRVKRVRGGIVVSYRGAGDGPALCLAAHLDHPAFDILSSSSAGAKAVMRGRLPPHLLAGFPVEAFGERPKDNRPLARGYLGPQPAKDDGAWTIRWTEPPPAGKKPDFAVLELPACEVRGDWLVSRSIDDLLGCAVSLEAVRRLSAAKAKANVVVLLNRAEEVGFIGALDMLRSGVLSERDSYLSIESSRELPGSRPGKGPTIRLGDKATAFDPNLVALLDEAAAGLKKSGTKVQRLRLTGGTCEGTAYLAFGLEAAGVAVPLVNYHNGWGAKKAGPEMVRLSDVEGATRLLMETARLFPSRTLRGRLRGRLEKLHEREKRALT